MKKRTAPGAAGSARRGPLLAALGSFAVNAAAAVALGDHPLLQPDGGLDTGLYVDLGRRVAGGDVLLRGVPGPFFVSPLYAYFLGAVFAVTGGSLGAARLLQAALGAAAVWLAGDAARRLFGERAALPAAALLALTGVVVFHEAVLLQAALDPFLTALALWLLVRTAGVVADAPPKPRAFLASGLALGVLVLNRPNLLPWAGVVAALVAARGPLRESLRLGGAFALGVVLAVAPATLRNFAVSGEPVLVSSHGGLNFLIGNGPGAEGVYRLLEGITPSIAGQAGDATRVAEADAQRALSAREVSSHFARKAWAWIAERPGEAARLFARKLRLTIAEGEAPLNFSFPWYRDVFPGLRALFVGPWLLVPLGGAGIALLLANGGRLSRGEALPWISFAPSALVLVAAFFVATRYRLPLLVALATAGGGALALLHDAVRARRARPIGIAACVALPLLVLSVLPTGLDDGRRDEETQWIVHLASEGRAPEATGRAEALVKDHPQPGLVWFRLGQALGAAGRRDDGIAALERARAADPDVPEIRLVLSTAREARGVDRTLAGDARGAIPDFEAAAALDPSSASARLNLAAVLAEQGDRARARALAREALVLQPGYAKAEALLTALDRAK